MDNPGFTIFQGGGSIKLDNSIQRLEEEEELEDQRRRNAEVYQFWNIDQYSYSYM